MAYTGDIAYRPETLDGCFSAWTEQATDNVVKSEMESGVIKTRRRFTAVQRKADVSVRLKASVYRDFMDWYEIYQRQGTIPTFVKTPYGAEELWMFMTPPVIDWEMDGVFSASFQIYQQAGWND